VNPETSELLFLASEADFEEQITFPLAALRQCPNVKLHTAYIDSHIYVIRKGVLEEHLLPNKSVDMDYDHILFDSTVILSGSYFSTGTL